MSSLRRALCSDFCVSLAPKWVSASPYKVEVDYLAIAVFCSRLMLGNMHVGQISTNHPVLEKGIANSIDMVSKQCDEKLKRCDSLLKAEQTMFDNIFLSN
jgi:hypothetical protein